ncbi:uncharacterized protein B0P05DRAFT_562192 [Gilbertella persicaria]|uniref:uncharacterized protein n=1 Tax=Gilbertella persicaria TaxID=101096 RepID=UPI00221E5941|nr:uncharacterized protein B0P05DRAFT_562192 [Gilbertella persicaria]KAI8052621.1 hypothetical protein B0P05DRAFT_562192 [Gilbertella persicaria]
MAKNRIISNYISLHNHLNIHSFFYLKRRLFWECKILMVCIGIHLNVRFARYDGTCECNTYGPLLLCFCCYAFVIKTWFWFSLGVHWNPS